MLIVDKQQSISGKLADCLTEEVAGDGWFFFGRLAKQQLKGE